MELVTIREAIAENLAQQIADQTLAVNEYVFAFREAIEGLVHVDNSHGIDNLIDASDARMIAGLVS